MDFKFPAKLVEVVDGDTLRCDLDLGFHMWLRDVLVRLERIDTPETRTKNKLEKEAGLAVQRWLKLYLADRKVFQVVSFELDKYGRVLGDVYFWNGASCLTNTLLERGFAQKCGPDGQRNPWTESALQSILQALK
jgi:micrococcal nuclease